MEERVYMERALALAEQGRGRTSPNPMVGAVVLKGGTIVGEGFHARAGGPHAEIVALEQAGERARGGTLYVTLEPCCHTGRTPPCTEAVIRAGIRSVVCAVTDPNPKVSGRGIDSLKRSGIEVRAGLLAAEAERLNEVYMTYMRMGRPYVILKIAQTLDGRITAADGGSQWITGEASRRRVHRLRSQYDGVLVGVNTLIADNPRLTVRHAKGSDPHRLVLDSTLRCPSDSALFDGQDGAKTIIATTVDASAAAAVKLEERGADLWRLPVGDRGRIDLDALLQKAGGEGITSLLVEGGAAVWTSFLRARLADKIHLFVAPTILGSGLPAFGDLDIQSLSRALHLRQTEMERIEEDVLITGYLR